MNRCRSRLFGACLLILTATITAGTGWFVAETRYTADVSQSLTEIEESLALATTHFSAFMTSPGLLLDALRNEPRALAALQDPERHLAGLEQAMLEVAHRDPSFLQVRWIDADGMERVRIDRSGNRVDLVTAGDLQDKFGRYYVRQALTTRPGEIYVSRIDLNVERGRVVEPAQLTMRIAVPVFGQDRAREGIFVINRDANALLEHVKAVSRHGEFLVTDQYGNSLRGFADDGNGSLAVAQDLRIEDRWPQAWQAIDSADAGQATLDDGVWTWLSIDPKRIGFLQPGLIGAVGTRFKSIVHLSAADLDRLFTTAWTQVLPPAIVIGALFWLLLAGLFRQREREQRAALRAATASTQLRESEAKAFAAEGLSQALIRSNVNGMLLVDSQGRIVMTNPALDALFGYDEHELSGMSLEILVAQELSAKHRLLRSGYNAAPRSEMMLGGRPVTGRHKNGSLIPIEVSLSPVPSSSGVLTSATIIDIRDRMHAERELRKLASVFENSGEGIFITDRDWRIVNINNAFSRITDFNPHDVIGQSASILRSARHDDTFYAEMDRMLHTEGHWRGEHWAKRRDGRAFPQLLSISHVRDETGSITHYVHSFSDISSIKQTQHELERLAHHDALTGLPNRVLLAERVHHAIARAARHGNVMGMMFIDLDNFKHVNDGLGHAVGDQLLKQVSDILSANIRKEDTVARIGGDEFVVLLEDIDDEDNAAILADKLLASLDIPFVLKDESIRVTASMGICCYPRDGQDYETLMRHADAAMFLAKANGRNRYHYYTKGLTGQSAERLKLEYSLRHALELDQLFLVYQPQIDMQTGVLVGVEALVRWQHPERGLIPPNQFIPLAEESGLINHLERWIIHTACSQAATWTNAGVPFGRMAINLSGRRIESGGLPDEIGAILKQTGCLASNIELEVAEGFIMQRAGGAIEELLTLRGMGIHLAIDDFGTGYSSLAYLKQLPINKLKIDQGFVRDIGDDTNDREIVSAVIAMGRKLGLSVIAEGVENQMQADFLIDEGCTLAQGFLYDRPMVADELQRRATKQDGEQPNVIVLYPPSA